MNNPSEVTQFVSSLRELADFYEANPNAPVPSCPSFNIFASHDPAVAKEELRRFGSFKKEYLSDWFVASKQFGSIRLELNARRDKVCRKVVIGTREIPEHVIPAQPETLVPAHTEEITEWQCDEPILKKGTAA